MKAIFFRLTILTLIPLIFNTPTLAQLYELEFTVSDDLRQCGSSADNAVDLKFTNRSGGSLNGNFTLDFSLQSPGASQVSINPSSITFSLNNLANNDFIVFTSLFSFLIPCNYNLDPVSNASFHCQAGLLFDNGTSSYLGIQSDYSYSVIFRNSTMQATAGNFDLAPGYFFFQQISGTNNLTVNTSDFISNCSIQGVERIIEYKNTGSLSFNDEIEFYQEIGCANYLISNVQIDDFDGTNSIPISYPSVGFPISSVNIPLNFANSPIDPGHILRFRITYTIDPALLFSTCVDHCVNKNITTSFTAICGIGGNCNAINSEIQMVRGSKRPLIRINRTSPTSPIVIGTNHYWSDQDFSTVQDWSFEVENIGDDIARDVLFSIVNPLINSVYYLDDLASVQLSALSVCSLNVVPINTPNAVRFIRDDYSAGADLPLCLTGFNPVKEVACTLGLVLPGDKFIVRLRLRYCCPSDDPGGFSYSNVGVDMNHWQFANKTYQDECSPDFNFPINRSDNLVNAAYFVRAGLNTSGSPDVFLDQSYYNNHSDMDMDDPPACLDGQASTRCCSTPMLYEFVIANTAFNKFLNLGNVNPYLTEGAEAFVDPYDPVNLTASFCSSGIVVKVITDPNLELEGVSTTCSDWVFFRQGTNVWNASTATCGLTCTGSPLEYTYYFDFSQIPGLPPGTQPDVITVLEFLSNSDFIFNLRGCCDCDPNHTNPEYRLEFYLRGRDNNCDIPLTVHRSGVQLHCPGCVLPGPIVEGGSDILDRTTYGFMDSDNDGLSDFPLTAIPDPVPANLAVARNRSMQGDLLKSEFNVRINQALYPDYGIQALNNPRPQLGWNPVNLNHMYLEIRMPHSGVNEFDVRVQSIRFVPPARCSCNAVTITATDPQFVQCVEDLRVSGNSDVIAFDLGIPSLIANFGITGLSEFQDNDEFQIVVEYCVNGNGPDIRSWDPDDNRFESLVQAACYLTATDYWDPISPQYDVYYSTQTPPLLATELFQNNQPVDPDWLFVCETRSGYHYFFSQRRYLISEFRDYDRNMPTRPETYKCNKTVEATISAKIGGDIWNVFPFEYRIPSLPRSLELDFNSIAGPNPPVNCEALTSASTTYYTYDAGCNPAATHITTFSGSLTPVIPNPAIFRYDLNTVMINADENSNAGAGCNSAFAANLLFAGDEKYNMQVIIPVDLSECASNTIYTLADNFIRLDFQPGPTGCVNSAVLSDQSSFSSPTIQSSNPRLVLPMNGTGIGIAPSSINSGNVIDQTFTLANNCPGCIGREHSIEHTFIFLPDESWIDFSATTINGNLGVPIDWFPTGSTTAIRGYLWPRTDPGGTEAILFGQTRNVDIHLVMTRCFASVINNSASETLLFTMGWNCTSLTGVTEVHEANLCFHEEVPWELTLDATNFDIFQSQNLNLDCVNSTSATISLIINSTEVTNPVVYFVSPIQYVFPAILNLALPINPSFLTISLNGVVQGSASVAYTTSVGGGDVLQVILLDATGAPLTLFAGNTLEVNLEFLDRCISDPQLDAYIEFQLYCGTQVSENNSKSFNVQQFDCPGPIVLSPVCNNTGSMDLTAMYGSEGSWSGPGIVVIGSNYYFDPSLVSPLPQTVTITRSIDEITDDEVPLQSCYFETAYEIEVQSCGGVATLNSSLSCIGQPTTISIVSTNLLGPFTYVWFSNGSSLGTTASITVSPTTTTVYTVIVTGNNNTTASATTTVQVLSNLGADCCVPSDFVPGTDFSLANTTISAFAATAGWGSSVSTANKILINGTLTVDMDFEFYACDHIVMGPNAQFVVLPGYELNIRSSHVYSCGPMWQSIAVQPDGRLIVHDSFIEDGLVAIRSWGVPALIEVIGNTFDANKTAVELTEGDFGNATFYENRFICTRYIKPASNLEWASHQFSLRDAVNVTIGDATKMENVLEDAKYGIFASRSSLSVQNNSITRQYNPDAKYGIYASGTLVVGQPAMIHSLQAGTLSANRFGPLSLGVFVSRNYDVTITGNFFDETALGIAVVNDVSRSISITENTLSGFSNYGIQLQDDHYSDMTVSGNRLNDGFTFSNNPESRKGIYVNNSTFTKGTLVIEGNDISNCYTGIHVMNHKYATIKGNVIHFSVPDQVIDQALDYRQGIWLQLSQDLNVQGNQLLRNCTSCGTTLQTGHEKFMRGIICDQAQQAQVHDNTLQNIPQGMLTRMMGLGNQYFCNYLEGFMTGIYFDMAQIDPQGDVANTTDNQWALGTGNKIDGQLIQPLGVDWYFDVTLGPLYNPVPYSILVVAPQTGISSGNCNVVLPIVPEPKKLSELLEDSTYQAYLTEKKLYDRLIVYRQLKDSLQLMYSGTTYDLTLQNFFNLMALGNTGYLENVKDALNSGDKTAAELANSQVTPVNLHESNSKTVNAILIASDKDSIYYDNAGRGMLLSIAYQNPLIGGEAVYRARAILRLDLEDQTIGFRVANTPIKQDKAFSVFPNPTTGEFMVSTSATLNQEARLTVYNLLGIPIQIGKIPMGQSSTTIELNAFEPGIYRLVIESASGSETHSIVLMR